MVLKRITDFCVAGVMLVVFSPLIIGLSVIIKLTSRGPVFYRGERTGLSGKPFRIYKFRSMVANADKVGGPSTSDSDARITSIGKIIRKFKLDELSQLINVFVGDMSLVGPRPEVKYYTDQYVGEEHNILTIRPGITDWASLSNPDEGSVLAQYDDPDKAYEEIIRPEKLRLQLAYVRERSFVKDIQIIYLTAKTIITRKQVPLPSHVGRKTDEQVSEAVSA